ncbi:MAG: glycoside hydrolase family 2 protein [Caldilineae bacterium]|nr:glycoside hydrolase family 2 protein [Caldilineae bacterium]
MRNVQLFNSDWLYVADQAALGADDGQFTPVTLPHTNRLFSHRSVDNLDYQFVSTYRKYLDWTPGEAEEKVFLDFDGVMLAATVYANGVLVGEHLGGFTPFSIDLTDALQPGSNAITVYVDSRERTDVPPYGHLVDYLTFGGIYRDVHLRVVPPCHIDNVFVRAQDVLTEPRLSLDVRLSQPAADLRMTASLLTADDEAIASTKGNVSGQTTTLTFHQLPPVDLWTPERPVLHTVEISLYRGDKLLDRTASRFGFRAAEFRADGGFYLNGQRLKLFGLDRHQTFPYIGAAAPARLQRQDADILKHELGCNVVRTSHYPQSPHFLNRCDEIGLLVFEEIPGWQHIGDEAWQSVSLDELRAMIERDRNHPSVILWGVRINESRDDDDFYARTNALSHELDPTRPTGGVRNFLGSSFLEDVYTYNDFSNTMLEPTEQPHLITEFAGHMFPTKAWDNEERLVDHALLHARVQNLQMGNDRVVGAIGWAAFDYNTHIEFGSGDRICHHGVMDIFRLPKWAGRFYESQQSPADRVVLHAATHWTMGDRSVGGVGTLTVFSNCDEIEVFVGDQRIGRYLPNRTDFPHLLHPPFSVDGLDAYNAWGQDKFYDLLLVGYVEGREVAQQRIASSRLPRCLALTADASTLVADGADMTRLVLRITDEFENPVPYSVQAVTLEINGDADLIGENPFAMVGGQGALYLKARHQPGPVTITARAGGLPAASTTVGLLPLDA